MKKIILALALCSLTLSMASCARGGNIDRGNGGRIGTHYYHSETTVPDTDMNERRRDLGEDIYNIPRDIRRGIRNFGGDIKDGIDRSMNDSSMHDNGMIK